jgi:hypothetical protein
VLVTHRCREADMATALSAIDQLPHVRAKARRFRIEDA